MTNEKITAEVSGALPSDSGKPFLSRAECNVMRGFAILLIVLDNFTHLLNGVFLDNEYNYYPSRVEGFVANLMHPDSLLPFNFISFYCPYGVMLFIFLSGYGLVLKYEKGSGQNVGHKEFLWNHYSKMFSMQVKGLALVIMSLSLYNAQYYYPLKNLLLQVLMVSNLNPEQNIEPGPYWFFGMIVEMYVIYRLLIYKRKDAVVLALVLVSLVAMAIAGPRGWKIVYLRINCFLAILPFCMGVLAARHLHFKSFSLHRGWHCLGWFLLAFVLLTATKFNFYSWLVMPVFVVATAVTVVKLLRRSRLLDNVFGWVGALSGVLFVVHPAVREVLIERANASGHYYGILFTYLLLTFGLSIILKPAFGGKKKEQRGAATAEKK